MVIKPQLPIGLIAFHMRHSIGAFCLSAALWVCFARFAPWLFDRSLPSTPFTIVGAALAIFLAFRTNSAYDRWWEGRKLWGGLVNTSRTWARQATTFVEAAPDASPEEAAAVERLRERLVRRQIAYIHALRCHLRDGQHPLRDDDCTRQLTEPERALLAHENNVPNAIAQLQAEELVAAARAGWLHELRLQRLDASLTELLNLQGGCERIKKTPVPRAYTYFATRIVIWYGILLPTVFVHDLGLLTIPISVSVAMCFRIVDEIGRLIQDPFSLAVNGLPLSALSKTIELNLRQRIGEHDPGPMPEPVDGILM